MKRIIIYILLLLNFVIYANESKNYSVDLKIGKLGSKDGEFNYPVCIVIDVFENIYISDWKNNRVSKFTPEGKFVKNIGEKEGVDQPVGLAINSKNELIVVSQNSHQIFKFDLDGKFISKFGKKGSKDDEFNNPRGIAVDSKNNIYVCDFDNMRISVFDESNKPLRQIRYDLKSGKYYNPRGVAVIKIDNKEFLFGVYTNSHEIVKFDLNGNFLDRVGSTKDKDSKADDFKLRFPRYIVSDIKSNIYVTDQGNDRIVIFDHELKYKEEVKLGFLSPEGLAVNITGDIFVTNFEKSKNNNVLKLKLSDYIRHKNIADILFANEKTLENAIFEYEKVLNINPFDETAKQRVVNFYLERGKKFALKDSLTEAENEFAKVLKYDKFNKEVTEFYKQKEEMKNLELKKKKYIKLGTIAFVIILILLGIIIRKKKRKNRKFMKDLYN